jgi:copper chaperone CopZ
MVERTHREGTKKPLKPEAQAVLSYLRAGHEISSDVIERELRKLGGIKEIVINPVNYVVKIHYDPRAISAEKMRSVLKKLGQGEQIETRKYLRTCKTNNGASPTRQVRASNPQDLAN